MARQTDPELERLRHRFWVRHLRTRMSQSDDPALNAAACDLTSFGRFLVPQLDEVAALGHDKRFRGVYHEGTNARRLVRRVPLEEMQTAPNPKLEVVLRQQPGRVAQDDDGPRRKLKYQVIPLDLVEEGDTICSGSAEWHSAPLWWLAQPTPPELSSLRASMAGLKQHLGLCNPSLDVLRHFLEERDYHRILTSTQEERSERYSKSLSLLSARPTAAGMSLLGALILDNFLTNNREMMDLHQDHFEIGVQKLLSREFMQDIAETFNELITKRFMWADWEFVPFHHVASLDEPFMAIADMEQQLPLVSSKAANDSFSEQ